MGRGECMWGKANCTCKLGDCSIWLVECPVFSFSLPLLMYPLKRSSAQQQTFLTFQLQDGGVENYRINFILFVYLLQRLKCTKRDQTIHEIAFFFYVHFFAGRLFSIFCKLFEQITYRSKVVNLGSNTYFHFLKEIFWEVKTHEKSNPILFIPFMKKTNK